MYSDWLVPCILGAQISCQFRIFLFCVPHNLWFCVAYQISCKVVNFGMAAHPHFLFEFSRPGKLHRCAGWFKTGCLNFRSLFVMPFPLGNVVDISMNLSSYYVMVCRFTGSQIFIFWSSGICNHWDFNVSSFDISDYEWMTSGHKFEVLTLNWESPCIFSTFFV